MKYKNGSLGVINYFANGHKSYSKERLEVFYQGNTLIMDNFRKLYGYGMKSGFNLSNIVLSTSQNKGHATQFSKYIDFLNNGGLPIIPFNSIIKVS